MKHVIWIISLCFLSACLGIDLDKVSDKVVLEPNVSLPLGKVVAKYEDIGDFPVVPPPVLDPFDIVEQNTVFFEISSDLAKREEVLSIMLRFDTRNRFPAALEVELYYQGSAGIPVFLTDDPIKIDAAERDNDGRLTRESTDLTDIQLTDSQIDDLFEASEYIIRLTIKDLELYPEIIRNLGTYSVESAIGVRAHVRYQTGG